MYNFNKPNLLPSATGSNRSKVALKPGFSLMDWVKLANSGKDLAGTNGKETPIPWKELQKHRKESDCWMSIKGKVYNITPYIPFHPGGVAELMKGAGADGTSLFLQAHPWVNYESMLAKCLIGPLVGCVPSQLQTSKSLKQSAINLKPKYYWEDKKEYLTVTILSPVFNVCSCHILINISNELYIVLVIKSCVFSLHVILSNLLTMEKPCIEVDRSKGSVLVKMKKEDSVQWSEFGMPGPHHNIILPSKTFERQFRKYSVVNKTEVTHDTILLCLKIPQGLYFNPPLGAHVFVRRKSEGFTLERPYTILPELANSSISYSLCQTERIFCNCSFCTNFPLEKSSINSYWEHLNLFIKLYPEGSLTKTLIDIAIGDQIEVSDPVAIASQNYLVTHLTLLAAGTGITPMLRILDKALSSELTESIVLMMFNKTQEDIPFFNDWIELTEKNSKCKVIHILSKDESWCGLRGHISVDVLKGHIPEDAEDRSLLICACGPVQFNVSARKCLSDLGYSDNQILIFEG